ncbi:RNA-directed DNA polymerase, eukaryota, Reverse transcriptase zinc-binding domain protein [Artemisia annua]|uniref:RNA-directed DNA polymerase, eukaryota, Reverse transcriptase zinc-binding domain protein n=1 Tax=Artemisia annua TaxID=35608 RepID=A0A2U1LYA2_ARTAN|nr:RNA-directed DNA polymerase, eukaryota, Reverse transcriptase zinc-binding domain protein [Artemisia annua]
MPVSIRRQLESMRNKFFIGGDLGDKKMTLVKWDKCLASKQDGGLGIGNGGVTTASNSNLKRSTWGAILSSINNIKQKGIDLISFCSRKVSNGIDSRFWSDIWCGDQPFKMAYPRIYLLDSDKNCNIASRVCLNDWSSVLRRNPRGGVESIQFRDLLNIIRGISLSDQRDSWQWSLDSSNGYSVASVRSLIDSFILETGSEATRWNRNIPIKNG